MLQLLSLQDDNAAAAPATIAKPAANGVGAKPAAAAVKHK
jgi:hypothetical protein